MGDFVKGARIGEGSFGTVYKGMRRSTGDIVAIKEIKMCLDSDTSSINIDREFQLLESLDHPNIVRVLDKAVTSDSYCIVMEFVGGGSLSSLLSDFGKLNEQAASSYTRQILDGLRYLHKCNVLHRDLKPANILLDQNSKAKIADFGAAKQISDLAASTASSFKGTPLYMAPEILHDGRHTKASDIWALGCTVLEMLTAQRPWHQLGAVPALSLMYHIGHSGNIPTIPPTLHPNTRDFLERCFDREASNRASCEELLSHCFLKSTGPAAAVTACIAGEEDNENSITVSSDRLSIDTINLDNGGSLVSTPSFLTWEAWADNFGRTPSSATLDLSPS